MSTDRLRAQAKAAAWGLVALVGVRQAVDFLQSIIAELNNSEWEGPGNR
jgi:hypothetical protein